VAIDPVHVQVSNFDIQHYTAAGVEQARLVHPSNELFQLVIVVA
jgi:hypothetical protein